MARQSEIRTAKDAQDRVAGYLIQHLQQIEDDVLTQATTTAARYSQLTAAERNRLSAAVARVTDRLAKDLHRGE